MDPAFFFKEGNDRIGQVVELKEKLELRPVVPAGMEGIFRIAPNPTMMLAAPCKEEAKNQKN
ncbi:MAG: hypothetical protein WCS31_06080 [Verrucomicrobiae bacterium]